MPLQTLSTIDARATEKAIWRYLDKTGGYQPYGWDWPTLRMLYPRIATVLKACHRAQAGLLIALVLVGVAFAADKPVAPKGKPVAGSRGGCYVEVVSKKTGKTYRKYVSKDLCKGAK